MIALLPGGILGDGRVNRKRVLGGLFARASSVSSRVSLRAGLASSRGRRRTRQRGSGRP